MMKLAYLINQYPRTSHSFVRREVAALEAMGCQVLRVSIQPVREPLVEPADQAEQARTRALLRGGLTGLLGLMLGTLFSRPLAFLKALVRAVKLGWHGKRGVVYHLAYLGEACRLRRWLEQEGVEHLHAHFGTNPASVAMLCRDLGGPPFSFTVHGPEEFDDPLRWDLSQKIRRAAFVAAVSSFGRSQLMRWAPLEDWLKLRLIRCGVDRRFLGETPADAPHPSDPTADPPSEGPTRPNTRFLCVGRLCEQKGQALLLQAMRRLIDQGVEARLILGGDGPMRPELEQRIEALGLGEAVSITGWISGDQVRQEMLRADVFVLPSFAEGLPVVLMEALALGRPAISTYVAGIPELIEPEVSGWLIPAGDVAALTWAMAQAARTPLEDRQRMGAAGRERVAQRHDVDQEAAKLLACFRAAAQGEPMAETLDAESGGEPSDAPDRQREAAQ